MVNTIQLLFCFALVLGWFVLASLIPEPCIPLNYILWDWELYAVWKKTIHTHCRIGLYQSLMTSKYRVPKVLSGLVVPKVPGLQPRRVILWSAGRLRSQYRRQDRRCHGKSWATQEKSGFSEPNRACASIYKSSLANLFLIATESSAEFLSQWDSVKKSSVVN